MNIKTRNRRKQNTKKKNKRYFHKSEKKKIRNISNKKGGAPLNQSAPESLAPAPAVTNVSRTQNVVNNDKCIKEGNLVTDNNNELLGIVESIDNTTSKIKIKDVEVKKNISDVKLYQYYDILGLLSQIVTNVIEMKNGGSPPKDINNISKLKESLENAVSLLKWETNNSPVILRKIAGFTTNNIDSVHSNGPSGYDPPSLENVNRSNN